MKVTHNLDTAKNVPMGVSFRVSKYHDGSVYVVHRVQDMINFTLITAAVKSAIEVHIDHAKAINFLDETQPFDGTLTITNGV